MTVGDLRGFLDGLPETIDGYEVARLQVVLEVPLGDRWSGVLVDLRGASVDHFSPTESVDPFLCLRAELDNG